MHTTATTDPEAPATGQRDTALRRFARLLEPARAPSGGWAGHGLPHLPGLDGLRAIAVGAVILYHAGVARLPGGFLGVEVFFVISGYLITSLLLNEWHARGGLDLRTFWLRRARRLFPALWLLLMVTLALFVLFFPREVATVRGDALAALLYVTNWYYIFRHQSYFEAIGRPSPLQHLWSLAIEEQFYLLWPLVLVLLLRRWSPRRLLVALLGAAGASALLMALLYHPGTDPSRVYYGTDTRATGLLLGSALAVAWAPWRSIRQATRQRVFWLDLAGLGGLAALLLVFALLLQTEAFLYRGGFVLIDVATAVVIAASVAPGARWVPRLLDLRPLRWLGERSYSLYLWHWPVFVVTRPQVDVPLDGLPLLVLRLGLTVILADCSYRFVEMPIRRGALGRRWRWLLALWVAPDRRSWRALQVASVAGGTILGLVLALGFAVAGAQPPAPPSDFATVAIERTVAPPTPVAATEVPVGIAIDATPTPTGPPVCPPAIRQPQLTAIGDSVMVGAAEQMELNLGDNLAISAALNRQAGEIPAVLRDRAAVSPVDGIVIVHIGTNGFLTDSAFEAIIAAAPQARAFIFMNVRVPREWEDSVNSVIAAGVARHPNAILIDWNRASAGHPEYFKDDGVHVIQSGRAAYANLIVEQVNILKARWAQEAGCVLPTSGRGDRPVARIAPAGGAATKRTFIG